jgi:hypothetical protein
MALVDERGCRRDIRSNGWIEFRKRTLFQKKSSLFQNRSGRRNRFSSFGAGIFAPQFHRAQSPKVKSGPDVFADALVPIAAQLAPGDLIPKSFSDHSQA